MVKPGFYRGIIVTNVDPENLGQCKIYIPGVYPAEGLYNTDILPWSEPAMPLFGGSGKSENTDAKFTSSGWTSVPGLGTYVWVFFEGNDQNFPRHFAASQAGDAWMSEHEMQHVISTENFRITVDENPSSAVSTMQSNTVNDECTSGSKSKAKSNQSTRARIEIEADQVALDVVIKGDVNLLIDGDMFQKITGDRHVTVQGDDYLKVDGNTEEEHKGDLKSTRDGNSVETIKGTEKTTILKSKTTNVAQDNTTFAGGNNNLNAGGSNIQKAGGLHDHL
jgi:hypothetical protein